MTGDPARILIIRFHAIGDAAITLPACAVIRAHVPNADITYLTTQPVSPLISAVDICDRVEIFPLCTTPLERIGAVVSTWRRLRARRYDIVVDLQSNWVTVFLRSLLAPDRWAGFDRTSPVPAGHRVDRSLKALGLPVARPEDGIPVRKPVRDRGHDLLTGAGWDGSGPLVVLNPAGLWTTRRWPDDHYAALARHMIHTWDCQILFVGTDRIRTRVDRIVRSIGPGPAVIDLVSRTSLDEALGVLQHCSLVVSEDSGLMHMAWVSAIPTLALFGSSRHDWSTPLGTHTRCLHSGDLECGACMKPECRFGDVHCLTRYSPDQVFDLASSLLAPQAGTRVP